MSAISDRFRRRAETFERRVAAVQTDQWPNRSPCGEWDARGVVDHIVSMHGYMLRPLDRTLSPAPSVQQDPLGAFRAARADVQALLDDPRFADLECDTPAGRMTFEQQVDQVVSDDLVMHGWDLARATGQDETMDPEDVDRLWGMIDAIPPDLMTKYRTPGAFGPGVEVFGPEVLVPEDAPLQDRLLGMIGRNPARHP